MLDIESRQENGIEVVAIEGKLSTTTAREAELHLNDVTASGVINIVLNLEGVDFIASTGLRVILATGKKAGAAEGKLVVCGLNPTVKDVFRMSGFSTMFEVFETEEEALGAF